MDLDAVNNDFSFSNIPLLRFEETRGSPFLEGDHADYFCSVVRFSIQTGNSRPVFIPKIDPNGDVVMHGIPLSTIYKITFVVTTSNSCPASRAGINDLHNHAQRDI